LAEVGEEQLAGIGESDAVRARHAAYFAAEADRHFKIWQSPDQHRAYQWLNREMGNIRAGFRWAVAAGEVDSAVRIAAGTGDMARFCLHDEAVHWAAEVVDVARAAKHPRLMVLLTWACSNAWAGAELEAAKAYGEEAISLVDDGDVDPWVWAFMDLAQIAAYEGDVEKALDYISRGANQPADAVDYFCLAFKPTFLIAAGRQAEAEALVRDGQAKIEATGIPSSIAVLNFSLGRTFAVSDPERALACYEHGLEISRATDNGMMVNVQLPDAVALQARTGDPMVALVGFRDMIAVWRDSADMFIFSHGMASLVVLFDRFDRWDVAATMRGTLDSALQADALIQDLPGAIAHLREVLGEETYESHYRHGPAMNVQQAANYAEEQINLVLGNQEGDA
jgi:tetratricopeptide (TPR) repeat protein